MSDQIELMVGNAVYGGWESVEVSRSIESISGAFSMGVSERWPGQQVVAAVRPDAACKVILDGEIVVTGYVDETSPSYDEKSHSVKVDGRDATGDLVDCSADWTPTSGGGQRFNIDIVAMIQAICKPFGISVISQITGLNPIPEFVIHPGQTAFQTIQQLCSFAAVLPISDGNGNLILTRGGIAGTQAPLTLGGNILKASGKYSSKDRHSRYQVLGQSNGGGDVSPAMAIGGNGIATDPSVTRYRPLAIIADFMAVGDAAYTQRAQWEATVRAGRGFTASITVPGWRDANGELWQPNRLVNVDDDFLGLHDMMLISGVHQSKSASGTTTELSLSRRQAFELISMPSGSGIYDPTPSGRPA
jgi:prophage tail gpP-like protein